MQFSKLISLALVVAVVSVAQVAALTGGSHGMVFSSDTVSAIGANKVACADVHSTGKTRRCCGKQFFSDGFIMTCKDSKNGNPKVAINLITCNIKGTSGSCGDGVTNPKINVKATLGGAGSSAGSISGAGGGTAAATKGAKGAKAAKGAKGGANSSGKGAKAAKGSAANGAAKGTGKGAKGKAAGA